MTVTFDPVRYKDTTRAQWEGRGQRLARLGPDAGGLLGEATTLMLDAAGSTTLDVAAAGLATVRTRELDGERLDIDPAAFDAVISRLVLIYFPDQPGALAGQYRALRPGGRISAIVYSTADRNGFFSIPVSIIRRRAQLSPPAPGQPGPFSLGGPGVLEDAFRQAGFRNVGSQPVLAPLRMAHAQDCVRFARVRADGRLGCEVTPVNGGPMITATNSYAPADVTDSVAVTGPPSCGIVRTNAER